VRKKRMLVCNGLDRGDKTASDRNARCSTWGNPKTALAQEEPTYSGSYEQETRSQKLNSRTS
jgi:hypothetical protein